MEKYLYGAAVQGIQNFIFQTNELQDIVGASELVEQICTTDFEEFGVGGESVVNAAGNIKYIFEDKETCAKAVLKFPKKVMEKAPGITISQAVVKMEGEFSDFGKAVNELERKLRIQRNRPMPSLNLGLMSIERNRKTGLPAVELVKRKTELKRDNDKYDAIDASTKQKKKAYIIAKEGEEEEGRNSLCVKAFGHKVHKDNFPSDIKQITSKNDWIAVIHADGNGLGKIVQEVGKDIKDLNAFSIQLDEATKAASQYAYHQLYEKSDYKDQYKFEKALKLPIRPIVLGGDDFTVICRADFAVDYIKDFLSAFEAETEKKVGGILKKHGFPNKLTSCAGIAFIKSSFPFHYGVKLAESLCEAAKKDAKSEEMSKDGLPPSCLMFHKVQDSFVTDYNAIVDRELKAVGNYTWKFGPYYLNENNEGRMCISDLIREVKALDGDEGNAVKSSIRQWLSAMHSDKRYADQLLKRAKQIAKGKAKDTLEDAVDSNRAVKIKNVPYTACPAYDILSLHSVMYQVTK